MMDPMFPIGATVLIVIRLVVRAADDYYLVGSINPGEMGYGAPRRKIHQRRPVLVQLAVEAELDDISLSERRSQSP